MTAMEAVVAEQKRLMKRYVVNRFTPRYINLCAITDHASPISTQVWVESQDDLYEAEKVLVKWATPEQERWHGRIVRAAMFDPLTKQIRHFVREFAMLREVNN